METARCDNPTVLIDAGHGIETAGKCSPDGTHREWAWTRRAATALATALEARGIQAIMITPEDTDVPLGERVRRVNTLTKTHPGAVLISLHNNAAGDGKAWHQARGFAAFVAPYASLGSRYLARLLTEQAGAHGLAGNRRTPAEGFWRASLAMCRQTKCTSVLTENLFMDNREDLSILASPDGMATVVDIHVKALLIFFNIKS